MIEKLKQYNDKINCDNTRKLIQEINVEYPENEVLYDSLWTSSTRDKVKETFDKLCRYSSICGYVNIQKIRSLEKKLFEDVKVTDFQLVYNELNCINEFVESFKIHENKNNKDLNELRYYANTLRYKLEGIEEYITSNIIVVNGDGATGKTHLLTKLSKDLLNNKIPSIIFYGQSVSDFEKSIQRVNDYFDTENIFHSISNYSKSINEQAVIIFDGLNESKDSSKEIIIEVLTEISKLENLKIIISYRNGDLLEAVKTVLDSYPSIQLHGFSDTVEAAIKFSEHYNIELAEILEMDFASNPLILKIFCEAYLEKSKSKGVRGNKSATFYFESFFKKTSQIIVGELGIKTPNGKTLNTIIFWNKIAKVMANCMIRISRDYLTYDELKLIVDDLNLNVTTDKIIDKLVRHTLFEKITTYEADYFGVGYKFSFQKQSDFLISRELLKVKAKDQSWESFLLGANVINYLKEHPTIIESLVENIPIRTKGKELFCFYNDNIIENFTYHYIKGLKYRSSDSFGDNISGKQYEIIKYLQDCYDPDSIYNIKYEWFSVLASSLTLTYHPFNMKNYFSEFLLSKKNGERDMFLNGFIRSDDNRARLLSLLRLPHYQTKKISVEFRKNCALLYFWLLSVSDRELRDKATKSLTLLLKNDLEEYFDLINLISVIDDQYIIERFLCSFYGAHVLNRNDEIFTKQYNLLETKFVNEVISNARIRHYFSLINNLAFRRNLIEKEYSFYDLTTPSFKLWVKSEEHLESIMISEGLQRNYVLSSLTPLFGDFGKYIVESRLSDFKFVDNDTLNKYIHQKKKFIENLTIEQKSFYNEMIKYENEKSSVNILDWLDYIGNSFDKEKSEESALSPEEKFFESLSENNIEIYKGLNSKIKNYTKKRITIEMASGTIVKKMFALGYSLEIERYDQSGYLTTSWNSYRNDHRTERIGKKYQWIAFFELLGECMTNLEHDYKYQSFHDLISQDIDAIQINKNKRIIYDFYDNANRKIENINVNWNAEDYKDNFDNECLTDVLALVEFEGEEWVPIHISLNIKNFEDSKSFYYRLNTILYKKENDFKQLDINDSKDLYALTQSQPGFDYNHNLFELINGLCDRYDDPEPAIIPFWKEHHLESNYDYSNFDMTKEGKNNWYYLLRNETAIFLNLKYDYAGAYYDENDEVVCLQSPFEAEHIYLYLRKDFFNKINSDDILMGVYSEKRLESDDPHKLSNIRLGSQYDAVYRFAKGRYELLGLHRREYKD